MSKYLSELSTAKKAAAEAAEVIQEYQASNRFSVDFKGKNDLVTDADIKAEELILSIVKDRFPDDHILAEESSDLAELPEGRTWLIDPIDGTTNFAHGFPIYCVSIGLWENREPKMGLVLEVESSERYAALAGKGAYLNGDPIRVSGLEDPLHGLIGTGFPFNDFSLVDNYIKFFRMLIENTRGLRRPGSAAYDLCCVASGRFDGFFEYSLSPWDVAAAALIVQEAGGVVTDWAGGDNWLFGERIIAGNPAVHQFLLDETSNYFDDSEIAGVKAGK